MNHCILSFLFNNWFWNLSCINWYCLLNF